MRCGYIYVIGKISCSLWSESVSEFLKDCPRNASSHFRFKNTECVEILLTRGADPKIVSRYGRTAVHYAAACGYEECLALLMQHGCDVNICPEGYPSPVISAMLSRRSKCLSMLLDTGEADVNFVDKFGENAILEASNRGMESHAQLLLEHGADVNSRSEGVYNRKMDSFNERCFKGVSWHSKNVDQT